MLIIILLLEMFGFEEKMGTFSGKYIYCRWDLGLLPQLGIDRSNIKDGEYFIVRYDIENDEVDVASFYGVKMNDGVVYHKLSELR